MNKTRSLLSFFILSSFLIGPVIAIASDDERKGHHRGHDDNHHEEHHRGHDDDHHEEHHRGHDDDQNSDDVY